MIKNNKNKNFIDNNLNSKLKEDDIKKKFRYKNQIQTNKRIGK